jgi:hypothetical protein
LERKNGDKSRALWLHSGDENTKFFQAYAKGRKMINTIWGIKHQSGRMQTSFEDMARVGSIHFKSQYFVDNRVSIDAVIQMALLFPSFVDEEENDELIAEVIEVELKEVLHSFQKDKSAGPDGWSMDFYVGLFDLFSLDLLKVIEESRINSFIHPSFNAHFYSLNSQARCP